jgi:hypothetical protein
MGKRHWCRTVTNQHSTLIISCLLLFSRYFVRNLWEHQVVQPPSGKPAMDGRGKILLILHKDAQGEWKIQQEMWNSAGKEWSKEGRLRYKGENQNPHPASHLPKVSKLVAAQISSNVDDFFKSELSM